MPGKQVFKDAVRAAEPRMAAFDPFGARHELATVVNSVNGQRLRVLQTAAAPADALEPQDYTPREDGPISAIQWVSCKGAVARAQRQGKPAADEGVLAIGHASGAVELYSASTAGVVRRLPAPPGSGAVSSIAAAGDGRTVFVATASGKVAALGAKKGRVAARWAARGAGPVQALQWVPERDGLLVVAQHDLQLWRIPAAGEPALEATLAGHATPIVALVRVPLASGAVLCSAAVRDRTINVWKIPDNGQPVPTTALCALACQSPPVGISAAAGHVLAACEDGSLCLWDLNSEILPNSEERRATKIARSNAGTRSKTPALRLVVGEPLFAAQLVSGPQANDSLEITVAVGLALKPRFATLVCRKDGILATAAALEKQLADAGISGQLQGVLVAPTRVPADVRAIANALKVSSEIGATGAAAPLPRSHAPEATLADRMHELGLLKVSPLAGEKPQDKKDEDAPAAPALFELEAGKLPSATSLRQLCQQAVQSGDAALLERCLDVQAPRIIDNTVARLETPLVLPLLQQLLVRLEARPARAEQLLTWLQAVLQRHMTYLLTVPDLLCQLSSLYRALESRTATYPKMLRLAGRLDLVLGQVEHRANSSGVDSAVAPAVVYDEAAEAAAEAEAEAAAKEALEPAHMESDGSDASSAAESAILDSSSESDASAGDLDTDIDEDGHSVGSSDHEASAESNDDMVDL